MEVEEERVGWREEGRWEVGGWKEVTGRERMRDGEREYREEGGKAEWEGKEGWREGGREGDLGW